MKKKLVIVMLVQLICACGPLSGPVSAEDYDQDPEHLEVIALELAANSHNYKKTFHDKGRRHESIHDRGHIRTLPDHPQSDLLRELQVNEDMHDADELEFAIQHQAH